MAAAPAKNLQKLIQNSHIIKRGAEKARQDIFGHLPQLNLDHTGNKAAKKGFMGPYLERYYPTSINVYARKVRTGIMIGYCEFIFAFESTISNLMFSLLYSLFRFIKDGRQNKRSTEESN
jgi:hypothetical protein